MQGKNQQRAQQCKSSRSHMSSVLGEVPSSTGVPSPPPNDTPHHPTWTHSDKKRIIPSHLAPKKKPGFHIHNVGKAGALSASTDGRTPPANSDIYNIVSFGNQLLLLLRRQTDPSKVFDDTTIHEPEDLSSHGDQDLPPARLLHDLQGDVLSSSFSKKQQQQQQTTNADLFTNKDFSHFSNIFTPRKTDLDNDGVLLPKTETSPDQNLAVLVFGYPEPLATLVIQHFKNFGQVLEDFDSGRALKVTLANQYHQYLNSAGSVPILCGDLWMKITYKTQPLAIDALQENGTVFNGALLGVVPYTKACVEKLEKRQLLQAEDIGGVKIPINTDFGGGGAGAASCSGDGCTPPGISSLFSKLDIKDGSNLFLAVDGESEKQTKKELLGLLANMSRYFFGFHEL